MIRFLNSKKGFTITEIIASSLIVVIAAAGTYSAYLFARQFSDKFRHKTMATRHAAQVADALRYRQSYNNNQVGGPDLSIGTHTVDVSGWGLNNEVNSLAASYAVSDVWFVNGTEQNSNPGTGTPAFKKIVVTVNWNERG